MLTELTSDEWLKVQQIFDAAVSLQPELRAQFLDTACAETPALRTKIEALLQVEMSATLDPEVGAGAQRRVGLPRIGEHVGPYRILEVIGRGGMGVVYRAVRDDDQYRKEVAIKVAAAGGLSPELRQRFLGERQILASLSHPNIARLLDGGATADGVPYVVMEFVDGKPIDVYCTTAGLDTRQKIVLMVQVARAVDYAHKHLVVHRDLKPENIYVIADGTPKLLDFGIAKALDPAVAGMNSSLTVDAARLMTPKYASPEQVRGEAITTATDVYQIGVLLYSLLAGRKLFQPTKGSKFSVGELERMICETPPQRPNVNRDLDQVILHALEKEPRLRYPSAGELADDLERYLRGFPVNARAASRIYRARKFVLRHKLAAGSGGAIVVLLLVSTMILRRQRDEAQAELRRADMVSAFLQTVFSSANPDNNQGSPPTVQQLLDHGVTSVETSLGSEPEAKADLLTTFGQTYSSLGRYDRADTLLMQALALYQRLHEEHTAKYADCLVQDSEAATRRGDFPRGIAEAREAVAISTSVSGPYSEATAHALDTLGFMLNMAGDATEAKRVNRQTIAVWEKIDGPDTPNLFAAINSLAELQAAEYKDQEAEALYRRELTILERDPSHESDTSDVLNRYGLLLDREGRYAQAEAMLRAGLAMRTHVFGPTHPLVGLSQDGLGTVLLDKGKLADAETYLLTALQNHLKSVGPSHRYVASDDELLGELYERTGELAKAEMFYRRSLALRKKLFGEDSAPSAAVMRNLGRLLVKEGRFNEAWPLLQQALAIAQKTDGEDSPPAAAVLIEVGRLELAEHADDGAAATLGKALEELRSKAPNEQPAIATTLELLGQAQRKEQRRTGGLGTTADP